MISPKVIIDTDSGSDDTFCIGNMLSLYKQNKCNILGITTGCGNIPANNSFQTANKVVNKLFNSPNIPIYNSPISSIFDEKCSLFYGNDGHYGKLTNICNKIYSSPGTSEEFLLKCLNEIDDLTIIAIGPLTNLDLCEKMQPGILKKAKEMYPSISDFEFHSQTACLRPSINNDLPFIDKIPNEEIYIASGGGGWGIMMSIMVGEILYEILKKS